MRRRLQAFAVPVLGLVFALSLVWAHGLEPHPGGVGVQSARLYHLALGEVKFDLLPLAGRGDRREGALELVKSDPRLHGLFATLERRGAAYLARHARSERARLRWAARLARAGGTTAPLGERVRGALRRRDGALDVPAARAARALPRGSSARINLANRFARVGGTAARRRRAARLGITVAPTATLYERVGDLLPARALKERVAAYRAADLIVLRRAGRPNPRIRRKLRAAEKAYARAVRSRREASVR